MGHCQNSTHTVAPRTAIVERHDPRVGSNTATTVPKKSGAVQHRVVPTVGVERHAPRRHCFRNESPLYRNLAKAYDSYNGLPSSLAAIRGVFLAAKSDYEGGYLFRVETRLSGEIFGDFVVAAKAALAEGQKDVAAVLACAALEDALKRFARLKGLQIDGKTM